MSKEGRKKEWVVLVEFGLSYVTGFFLETLGDEWRFDGVLVYLAAWGVETPVYLGFQKIVVQGSNQSLSHRCVTPVQLLERERLRSGGWCGVRWGERLYCILLLSLTLWVYN